jgi:hypothetical protein
MSLNFDLMMLSFANRAQRVFDESIEAARRSCRKLEGLRTRLEFRSADSEAGSLMGMMAQEGKGEENSPTKGQP